MLKRNKLVAVLAATTCLAAGVAYAADQATEAPPAQSALTKDVGKLSADASKAYIDVALTRLAIFDGRVKDAKTYVNEADSEFDKAKTDESVFVKAESELKSADQMKAMSAKKDDKTAASDTANDKAAAADSSSSSTTQGASTTPKRWLPVDAAMSVDEDYSANPQKAAAVSEANKKLAKGDKQGAVDTLKLADVNLEYVMAVVPLDQTLKDVHEAATDVNDGKYYEASQELRQVQASTRYDLLDVNGVPNGHAKSASSTSSAPSH